MQQPHVEEINFLAKETGFSRKKCQTVLAQSAYDCDKALVTLNKMKGSLFEVSWDRISAYLYGEKTRVFYVYDGDKLVMRWPAFFPIVILLITKVPSWVIAVLLLMVTIFDFDIRTEPIRDGQDLDLAVMTKPKRFDAQESTALSESGDGFYEYTVK
ncbi:MAG: hypothetical protein FWG30_06765 [Eubacteriaceae bacterium]|nr:hypothetical protein [Eubacteriaceae bacterium]